MSLILRRYRYISLSVCLRIILFALYFGCFPVPLAGQLGFTFPTVLVDSSKCFEPTSVTINPRDDSLIVTCNGPESAVISIQGSTITPLVNITQCPSPTKVLIDPIQNGIIIACEAEIGIISLVGSTLTTIINSNTCTGVSDMALDSVKGILYIACFNLISIQV